MVGTFIQLSGGLGPDGLASNSLGWLAVAQAQAGRSYLFDKVEIGLLRSDSQRTLDNLSGISSQ